MESKLSQLQIDALKEVVTIGAGNAATALSQMIRKKVYINVPLIKFCALSEVEEVFGGAEKLISAVYLHLLGDASGVILFSFHKREANRLVDLLTEKPAGTTRVLKEMDQSALKETGAILSGAYLNAISKLLKMRLLVSSPGFAEDMAGAIIDNILIETSKEADGFFVINTELMIIDEKVDAFFFFIPEPESLDKMLHAIGMNNG